MSHPTPASMSYKSPIKGILGLFAAAVLVMGASNAALADSVVYTMSNDPAGNAILAYNRDAQGKLTPLPGSPFPTGGLGVSPSFALGPFDSDQEIILNADKTRAIKTVVGGRDGKLTVNGHEFDGVMPAWSLSDEDIANVITYIYNSWGNSGNEVLPTEVKAVRGSL